MTSSGLFPNVELMLGMALAGFVFGLAYFAALRRTVALIAAGSGWRSPTALTLGRIAAATLLFAVAAIKLASLERRADRRRHRGRLDLVVIERQGWRDQGRSLSCAARRVSIPPGALSR